MEPSPRKIQIATFLYKSLGYFFPGIRKVLYWQLNILKYSTVIANSNVILPKLKANLCKLGSEIRMMNDVLHHDHCLSTYSQQNKGLFNDFYTFYLQPYSCPE